MLTIKIADETADALMRDILRQDYQGLTAQVAELKLKQSEVGLPAYAAEDLAFSEAVLAAMDVIMEYYIGHDWRSTL